MATFINVFGLTLGLIGLVLTLLYSNDQLSFDHWNPEKDRVFAIGYLLDNEADVWGVSNPQMEKAKANIGEIEDILLVSAMGYQPANITAGDKVVYATKIVDATSNFFSFFPFQFLEGNPETAIKADNQIAVSDDFAKKLFGNENAMGKNLQIGSTIFVINGVYRIPGKSVMMPEVVVPFKKLDEYWGNFNYNGYFKTKSNISIPDLKEKYDRAVWREQFEKEAKEEGITLDELMEKYPFESIITTLPDSHFDMKNSMTLYEPYGNRSIIKIMFGISILILMISVVNFINLSLAGAVKRAKEVGLRKAIGASRKQIIYQNLFETLILTLFSLLAAMVGIELILPFFNEFMQTEIEINPAKFFFQLLLIVIGTSLLTGIIPALYLSKFRTIEVLKGSFSRSSKGIYLRNAMLGLQFMIAAFFFVGSLIVYFQISYLNKLDLGFDKQQLMVLDFKYKDGKPFRSYEQVKTYLENMDGVTDVNSVRPLAGSQTGYSTTELKYNDKKVVSVLYNSIDFGYPEMMKMKLLKGR
ncbi:MAG: ABC transporter permease, partial [Moheibacter sp.]